jgi:heme-degrading monooxygenase HmoA
VHRRRAVDVLRPLPRAAFFAPCPARRALGSRLFVTRRCYLRFTRHKSPIARAASRHYVPIHMSSAAAARAFVALSRFTVANGMTPQVKEAFVNRPHLVDGAPGFLGMEVLCPLDNADEFWLLTRWADEQSYRLWHGSHVYHASHHGIPRGLKLAPGRTTVRLFERVCS